MNETKAYLEGHFMLKAEEIRKLYPDLKPKSLLPSQRMAHTLANQELMEKIVTQMTDDLINGIDE